MTSFLLLIILLNPPYYGETCVASWYGKAFHGRTTASGVVYDMTEGTCAHRWLPLGSLVRFRNPETGYVDTLRVTDRGPYVHGVEFDVSKVSFKKLARSLDLGIARNLQYMVIGRDTTGLLYNLGGNNEDN